MLKNLFLFAVLLGLSSIHALAEPRDTDQIVGLLHDVLERLDDLKDENAQLRRQVADLQARFDSRGEPQRDALAEVPDRLPEAPLAPQATHTSLTNGELASFGNEPLDGLAGPSVPAEANWMNEDRRPREDLLARLDPPLGPPSPLPGAGAASPQEEREFARRLAEELQARMPEGVRKYATFNVNAGPTSPGGDLSYTGQGRLFAPFSRGHAVQAQGEFLHYPGRDEAQFDIGLVNRWGRLQASGFGSFKSVNLGQFERSGSLGQAAFNLDYVFNRGRIGFVGAKGFLDGGVVNRERIAPSIIEETYLKVVDQVGLTATIAAWGRSWIEGNVGAMFRHGGSNKPGGTIRYVHPLNNNVALTLEAGMNETLISDRTEGRFVVGLQFGGWLSPARYDDVGESPVPVDVPRIRYEVLRRQVREGNHAPVADAGHDQVCTEAGEATLDAAGSFDPDGDPLTYEWIQIDGPAVELRQSNSEKATFTAAEGQTYQFRLEVSDGRGKDIDRVTVAACEQPEVDIVRFTSGPQKIQRGEESELSWKVLHAKEVVITAEPPDPTLRPEGFDPESGTELVSPDQTTTYTLVATGTGVQEKKATLTIQVDSGLQIFSFSASPDTINPGESALLTWTTEGADKLTIESDSEIWDVTGEPSYPVEPDQTTTYTLIARSNHVSEPKRAQVKVTVKEPGESAERVIIHNFTATPEGGKEGETAEIGNPGDPVLLKWNVSNAERVVLTGFGEVDPVGTQTVNPTGDIAYTLLAYGVESEISAVVVVHVRRPGNHKPVADAGPDIIAKKRWIQLDGSGSSDPDDDAIRFNWRVMAPNFDAFIADPQAESPQVMINGPKGKYVFELTVIDEKGAICIDSVVVAFGH